MSTIAETALVLLADVILRVRLTMRPASVDESLRASKIASRDSIDQIASGSGNDIILHWSEESQNTCANMATVGKSTLHLASASR